ncbi:hypothetical protein PQX77_000835 [Marasmius sp. AFHP31]|nr:hypothetical protein PQX77_000835 [Marasmius sp. AFHP31]
MHNQQAGSGVQNNNNAAGTQKVSFVNSFNSAAFHPHKTLWDKVAGVEASHTAEQQYERGECLEGTRVKALGTIDDWRVAKDQDHPILWLTGAAGVGKSAIAMTVAKSCEKHGLVSSFFCYRSDPRRNNPSALFLTIAHGLVTVSPLLRSTIEQRISRDPMILEARMENQFRELVIQPLVGQLPSTKPQKPSLLYKWSEGLRKIRRPRSPNLQEGPNSTEVPNLVIIDGLDECGDERTQLRVLCTIQSAFEHSPHFPLRFLICSRPESWIRQAFIANPLQPLTKVVVLDDSFSPDDDIMRYYLHQFRQISADPQYSQITFPSPWPSQEDLEILVVRACGQFVYAVTAVKFIQGAFKHPLEQLHVILNNVTPRPGTSPYQQLDALYDYILSVNPDHEAVYPILAAILVIPPKARTPVCIEMLLELPTGQVAVALRGMHSVLHIRGSGDVIRLFHTSFRDYLVDQARSGRFHIDIGTMKHVIAQQWLQNVTTSKVQAHRYTVVSSSLDSCANTNLLFPTRS